MDNTYVASGAPGDPIDFETDQVTRDIPYDPIAPRLGADVHYVSAGSADGTYPSVCRSARIVEVVDDQIRLMVMNPTGIHFVANVPYDPEGKTPLTWHWAWQD